ncbi:MAG TPA: type II secretion system minor pseudopilin GspK, partial [Gammaproteobacteria bacterium]|nr:type II secretion system minor pseudopilin GspK [Gammaproteobacteria bacterium]
AYAYALAAESWAEVILRRDAADSTIDTLAEDWATALPPIVVEGGIVSGHIEDLQGRFNVNNLIDASGKPSVPDVEYFKRLLALLGLDPALATALLDWIDVDINATFPDGAEDDTYLLETPPYRTANSPLVSASELRLVKGYSAEAVALLEPYITALPAPTALNVNTASPMVLQALDASLAAMDVEQIIAERDNVEGFKDIGDFLALPALAGLPLDVDVGIQSNWFSVLTDVRIGRGQARLDSRLHRDGSVVTVGYRVRSRRLLP